MQKKEIATKWNDMSKKGKAAVIEKLWLKKHPDFRRRPTPFDRFVKESYYLDQEKHVYPNVVDLGVRLMATKKNILIVEAGLGSGKSFLASLLLAYVTHLLLCLKDAHAYFGLSRDKPISLIAMNINETKARKIVFGSVSRFISLSPWFKQFKCEILKKSIKIDNNIELLCGNSTESAAIGLNLFMGVLDEANFFIDNDDKSGAEEIFDVITTRVSSRFGSRGLTVVISSSNHDEDFTNKKREEALANPDEMMFFTARTWNMKRRESMAHDVFVFDTENFHIIEPPQYEQNGLIVGEKQMHDLYFHDDQDERYWLIPLDYKSSFKRNPEKFARDLGCRSLKHSDKFIKMQGFIDASFSHDHLNWCKGDNLWELPPEAQRSEEPLYIHVDLGLNKETNNRMGDACGLAIGHFDGYDMEKGGRPRIRIVGLERITQDPQINEVRFADVRKRIIMLYKAGFEIAKVTIDGWQSIDTIQTLNDLGIPCELLSIDKTVEPYEAYKESMYESRIKIPYHETAINETKALIIIKGKKVDHPKGGCFTGETRIALADGTNPTFKELSKMRDDFYVYSIDNNGVSIKKARNARITKRAIELVEITLDNFQVIRCTPEHLFMTLDGEWVQAQNLTKDISIMPLYRTRSYKGGTTNYERVWCPKRNKRFLTHHLAVGGCPNGHIVHHKNKVKWNNDPRNLEVMKRNLHYSLHAKELWECKKDKMKEGHKKYSNDKDLQKKHSEKMKKLWKDGVIGKRSETCSIEECDRKQNARGLCDMHYQRAKRAKLFSLIPRTQKNHRILSVIRIKSDEDVYDLTVPETQNFALSSGVFVHNSKDCSDALSGVSYCIAVDYGVDSSPNNATNGLIRMR